jgi:hypothetical protein
MSRFRLRRGYGGRAEDAREARAQRRRAVRAGSLTLATSSPAGVALTAATTRTPVVATFLRFAGANGLVSLVGNLFIVAILVEAAGLDVVLANVVAVAICGLLNFQIGDRVVFRAARRAS